jgi:hypothetical protein
MEKFTDEDLKRLKEIMHHKKMLINNPELDTVHIEGFIEALLARLEAAEKVCQFHLGNAGEAFGRMNRLDHPLLKAWLERCGR